MGSLKLELEFRQGIAASMALTGNVIEAARPHNRDEKLVVPSESLHQSFRDGEGQQKSVLLSLRT